jgi:hypothetical protein
MINRTKVFTSNHLLRPARIMYYEYLSGEPNLILTLSSESFRYRNRSIFFIPIITPTLPTLRILADDVKRL